MEKILDMGVPFINFTPETNNIHNKSDTQYD